MAGIDDILAEAENPAYTRVTVARILLRQDMLGTHAELEAELAEAVDADLRENRAPQAPAISARILDYEAEIEAAKREFRFKCIGHRAWADLMAQHPPTKEQLKTFPRLDHNPETFPAAAIAAACIDPEMTLDEVHRLERLLNDTQFGVLLVKVVEANTGGVDAPKSAAASGIARRVNGLSANTPAPAASPAPSSSAA
jgi:hypothetical protein